MTKLLIFLMGLSISSLPAHAASNEKVQIINQGTAGFQKRFEMIARAQNSIDVEYFIYKEDEAGRLFTQALVKRKHEKPSLAIRILYDASIMVKNIGKDVITLLKNEGIEVKDYNHTSLFHFKQAQFRDHRKLIVIDGKEAITGSRNIADEYFDLSPKFNFRDRDIWVEGAIVKEMEDSFNTYWESGLTETPKEVREPKLKAVDFLTENEEDLHFRSEIARVGQIELNDPNSMGSCEKLTYVTDLAGKQTPETRKVVKQIYERLHEVKGDDKLYVESPYFIIRDVAAKSEMVMLRDKLVSAVLLTNSLASSDALYVAANFNPKVSYYKRFHDTTMYVYSGDAPKNGSSSVLDMDGEPLTENANWGIHAKSFVFSDSAFAVGTFNLDPRSANLNSEMMMFCEGSPGLTQYVKGDMLSRIDQSDLLGENGHKADGTSIFEGIGFVKRLKYLLAVYPSGWFSYLL